MKKRDCRLYLTIEWNNGAQCSYGPVNELKSNADDGLLWLKFDHKDIGIPLCNIKRIIVEQC